MAQLNAPHGLNPVMHLNGLQWNSVARMYRIPASDVSQYAIGDAVFSATGSDVAGVTNVQIATAVSVNRGVVVGIVVAPTAQQMPVANQTPNLNLMTIPATKLSDFYVMVVDDPFVIFEIMNNNAGAMTVTSQNANILPGTVGVNTVSQTVLNNASIAVTNTLQFKILGMVQRVTASQTSGFTPLLVKFNTHELTTSTGTTGV